MTPHGGAIAVWGSSGLSALDGHLNLQRGFFTTLWQAEPHSAKLGELLQAGYLDLVTNSSYCQDVLHTFLLLGDPLTSAHAQLRAQIYLPVISRGD